MNKSFCEKTTDKYLLELRKTDSATAKDHLLTHGFSSSSFEVPEYYGADGLSKIKLTPINWNNNRVKVPITTPLSFFTPKGNLSWRKFNLIHPYIFVQIVEEMTQNSNWRKIKSILCKKTLVYSYSTPTFILKDSEDKMKAGSIGRWLKMAENDIVKDSVNFSFLTVTDIKNFYPSIYTHSIAWAVNGRKVIKGDRFNYNLLGNRMDKLFQSTMDGQTNGIPVGSMVSDIIAEIILKSVDVELTKLIRSKGVENDVIITRYRDDYRILSKTNEQGKTVLKILSKILDKEYNLALNSDKTKVFDDILEGSFRDWSNEINDDNLLRSVKYENLPTTITASLLKDILLKTHRLQKKHPDGRASITLLSKLSCHLSNEIVELEIDRTDVYTIVSILRKISLLREESSAQVYLLLDALFENLDKTLQESIIDELYELIKGENDNDYQIIWLYRVCLSRCPDRCGKIIKSSKSTLIKILKNGYISGKLNHYEIFPSTRGLSNQDVTQLNKFKFVNKKILEDSKNSVIDTDWYQLFRY